MRQRRADGNEAGQVLVFRTQAVRDPRSHAGADEGVAAGVQFQKRSAVPRVRAVHRANQAQVIDAAGDVWEQLADPGAPLAVLLELPGRAEEVAGFAGDDARLGERQRLAVVALEERLVIE